MENIDGNGKGLSYLPLIMLALAMYVFAKTVYPDNHASKIYLINPPVEEKPAKNSLLAISAANKSPEPVQWTVIQSPAAPRVIKTLPKYSLTSSGQPMPSFSPASASRETQVEQLLAQGQTVAQISRQTGLKVKEIRKMKRRKKEQAKEKVSQEKPSSFARLKSKLFFWQ
jgi:hypothetical protein